MTDPWTAVLYIWCSFPPIETSGRESQASFSETAARGVADSRQFEDVMLEEKKSLPVSPQKIVFNTDLSSKVRCSTQLC